MSKPKPMPSYWALAEEVTHLHGQLDQLKAENAKLRELVEHLQPIDCEGNVLDIADTVGMLRSEYDGDHEWDDVVVELVLTKWGGDRWIVRGSNGEAWACDCLKTGYDEDAYEGSDDAEPIVNPSLIEVENAKLREVAGIVAYCMQAERDCDGCKMNGAAGTVTEPAGCDGLLDLLRELGVIA